MNDIEKAIETLKDMKSYFNDRSHRQYSMPAIDTAISALEKQMPKKVKWTPAYQSYFSAGDEAEPLCPGCGELIEDGQPICIDCYQIIDWSVEE